MDRDGEATATVSTDGSLQDRLAEAFEATVTQQRGESGGATAGEGRHIAMLADNLRGAAVTGAAPGAKPSAHPPTVTAYLPDLLRGIVTSPLADLVGPLAQQLDWYQIFDHGYAPDSLSNGLMAGQLIGGRGLLRSQDYYFGLFLVAPHVTYPLHQHAALEIYCVLSGEVFIRHGRKTPAMHITAGGHSVTPPHQVHELRTGDAPCLMAYGWTGDLVGENWWWEEQPDGSWDRICWRRLPDSSWKLSERQPLSEAEIIRAGDRGHPAEVTS